MARCLEGVRGSTGFWRLQESRRPPFSGSVAQKQKFQSAPADLRLWHRARRVRARVSKKSMHAMTPSEWRLALDGLARVAERRRGSGPCRRAVKRRIPPLAPTSRAADSLERSSSVPSSASKNREVEEKTSRADSDVDDIGRDRRDYMLSACLRKSQCARCRSTSQLTAAQLLEQELAMRRTARWAAGDIEALTILGRVRVDLGPHPAALPAFERCDSARKQPASASG